MHVHHDVCTRACIRAQTQIMDNAVGAPLVTIMKLELSRPIKADLQRGNLWRPITASPHWYTPSVKRLVPTSRISIRGPGRGIRPPPEQAGQDLSSRQGASALSFLVTHLHSANMPTMSTSRLLFTSHASTSPFRVHHPACQK